MFTVLDAKNGFWHIQLDEPSSFATTFGTPWGRYRWLRLPFGVSPAPEEFQRRIDIALEGLPGARFSKLPVITGPVKLFCFPFQIGVSEGLKIVQ